MSSFESAAMAILRKQGFTDFKKPCNKSFDYEAKKDNTLYAIEVKGTSQRGIMGRLVIPWHELRELYLHSIVKEQESLLLFINDLGEFTIFEMTGRNMTSS